MVQILQAKEVTLRDLINHFQLEFIEDEHFFGEWQQGLEAISEQEKELAVAEAQRLAKKLNMDLAVLGALQGQEFKLKDIEKNIAC